MEEYKDRILEKGLELSEVGMLSFFVIGVIIILIYVLRIESIRQLALRYKFVHDNEQIYLWVIFSSFMIGVSFYLSNYVINYLAIDQPSLLLTSLIALAVGSALSAAIWMVLKLYYPRFLQKHLDSIRFRTRTSPETGDKLMLLNADEKGIHLSDPKLALNPQCDYDVWIDEDTGFKLIEKYQVHEDTIVCPECHFRTLSVYKEKIVHAPTDYEVGLVRKYFRCTHCDHTEQKVTSVPRLGATSLSSNS